MFDQAFIAVGRHGGPNNATLVPVLYLYRVPSTKSASGTRRRSASHCSDHARADAPPAPDVRAEGRELMADSDVPPRTPAPRRRRRWCRRRPRWTLEAAPRAEPSRSGSRAGQARADEDDVVYTLLFAIALLYFVPFLWTLSTSFKTLPETATSTCSRSIHPRRRIETRSRTFHFARYAANSVGLAVTVTASTSSSARSPATRSPACGSPAARCCSSLVLATLMIPDQLRLVPFFVIERSTGLSPDPALPRRTC